MSGIDLKHPKLFWGSDELPDQAAPVWWDSVAASSGGTAAAKPVGGGGGGGFVAPAYYIAGPGGTTLAGDATAGFNIKIVFSGSGWTAAQVAVVEATAEKLCTIIVGDISDVTYNGQAIDDIVITVSQGRIDGLGSLSGNVLAQSAIQTYRDAGDIGTHTNEFALPVTASIKLDSSDLKNSGANMAPWDDVLLHEMIHVVGFYGPTFDLKVPTLLQKVGPDTTNWTPLFLGGHAAAALAGNSDYLTNPISASSLLFGGVPLSLFDASHWDEINFSMTGAGALLTVNGLTMQQEIMTATFSSFGEVSWLSDVTVGALADLGYTVVDPSAGASGWKVAIV